MFERLAAHHNWLLFVGDSDTRLLVCTLLQQIAEAGHGRGAVLNDSRLWMGESKRLPLRKWDVEVSKRDVTNRTRVCHLDWVFGAQGRVLSTRAIPCMAKMGHTLGSNATYAELGKDFKLQAQPTQTGRAHVLRVTYIAVTGPTSFVKALDHLRNEFAAAEAQRPSLLYLNAGLWGETVKHAHVATSEVLQRLAELGSTLTAGSSASSVPNSQLVWGTVVGHRVALKPNVSEDWRTFGTDFDREVAPSLLTIGGQHWQLLNRNTNLSRLAGNKGTRGIQLTDKHQPPLVNYVDLQRLFAAVLPPSAHGKADKACAPAPLERTAVAAFSPTCTGFGDARRDTRFLSAYYHFCAMDVLAHTPS